MIIKKETNLLQIITRHNYNYSKKGTGNRKLLTNMINHDNLIIITHLYEAESLNCIN